jgi:hypothetical protein
MFSIMVFTALLDIGFQLLAFPFLLVPELTPASATSFCTDCLPADFFSAHWPIMLVGRSVSRSVGQLVSQSVSQSVVWLVGRLNCCSPSPAQSFLASISSMSMTKIFMLSYICTCFEMGPPLRRRRATVPRCIQLRWRPHRNHRFQQLLCYCMHVCCDNLVTATESLPSNGCLCWLHDSGFQQTSHKIIHYIPGFQSL